MGKAADFKVVQIAGLVAMAVLASRVPVLQPILLGGLHYEHHISVHQIGHAATAEAIGMMIATIVAGAFLKPVHLRAISVVAALVMMFANGATPFVDAGGIIAARFINGTASGVLLWIFIGFIARINQPGRFFAIYVTTQSILSFLLSSFIMSVLLPRWGVTGGYFALLSISVMLLALSFVIPSEYTEFEDSGISKAPTAKGMLGLCAAMLFMAGIFSIWVYIVPLARQLGHSSDNIGYAINLAIGVQIIGGLAATRFADAWNGAILTAIAAVLAAIGVCMIMFFPQVWVFYASISLIAFMWMFTPSFHPPMILELDPSGRSTMFISTAQLGGIALGPMAASFMIDASDFRGAAMASIGAFTGCATLLALLHASHSRLTAMPKK